MCKSNLDIVSCERADVMVEYFNNVEKHRDELNEKLQEKFGEYASITCDTLADENGGDIRLSFGVYDVREELMNFIPEISTKLDIAVDFARREMENFLRTNDMNMDIDWEEDLSKTKIELFYNGEDYKVMAVKDDDEVSQFRFEFMDALYESVKEFLDKTINQSINDFNHCWVLEYSQYEEEL